MAKPSSSRTALPAGRSVRRAALPGAVPRTPWGWALFGGLAGAMGAMLLNLPAQWLASAVTRASNTQLQMNAPRGTVWDGSAQVALTGGADSQSAAALPGRVHWQLRPSTSGLRAAISADCCIQTPLQLTIEPRWSGMRLVLADGQSRWPATVLTGLGTPWNTLQLQGQLALQTQGLSMELVRGRLVLQGTAQLDALSVSSRLSTLRPMGSYRLALSGGQSPGLQLSTLDGALQLSGNGQWVGDRLRFTGEATAAPGREPALSNLLNIIGRRTGARSIISLG